MITHESIKKIATQFQTPDYPNVVREYFQHLFLSQLYRQAGSENLLFKGGTALRIIYGSPRFSEDLDFSLFNVSPYEQKKFVEDLFAKVLADTERIGIRVELGPKPGPTAEGYYGDAVFQIHDYPPTAVVINVSARNERKMQGEVASIVSDFVPTYNVWHLPQRELVEEKVFDALLKRKKARDFYDLYFIMRKGLLTPEQKQQLNDKKDFIIAEADKVDFRGELGAFLPQDQQAVVRDFRINLANELSRQLSGI